MRKSEHFGFLFVPHIFMPVRKLRPVFFKSLLISLPIFVYSVLYWSIWFCFLRTGLNHKQRRKGKKMAIVVNIYYSGINGNAKKFAEEYLSGFEVVIGTHIDRDHIHSHLVFNAVNLETGKKFHSNTKSYYQEIRAASDKLCRAYGLSVLEQSKCSVKLNYAEWLRQSKGQQTFRSMLEEDLKTAIQDANDLGHFFMLMEHKGYEISHGKNLGFKIRGQQHFMRPGRRNSRFLPLLIS